MARNYGFVCDACGKTSGNRIFWLKGHVLVDPYTGGVNIKKAGYSRAEIVRKKKTEFEVCSVECLGDLLASGARKFLPPRKIEGEW